MSNNDSATGSNRQNGNDRPAVQLGTTTFGLGPNSTAAQEVRSIYLDYAGALQRTLERMPWAMVESAVAAIVATWEQGHQVFIMGNGGSASTASHFACDLSKNTAQSGLPRMRAVAINDNMAVLSALANDIGYEAVFAEQINALARPGDLVVAISTSGNSPNVLRGIEAARRLGLRTIGFCGYTGGKLAPLVEIAVLMPNHCIEQVEDLHLVLAHIVTVAVRDQMYRALLRGAEFVDGVLFTQPTHGLDNGYAANGNGVNGYAANGNGANGNGANGYAANGNGVNGNGAAGVSRTGAGSGRENGHGTHVGSPNGQSMTSRMLPPTAPGYWQHPASPAAGYD